jgi:hypothetical protein
MDRSGAKRAVVGAMVLALSVGSLLAGCGGDDECEFDAVTRDIGGVGLTDCGIADRDDPSEVDECAVSAYRGNQTFRAIYEQDDDGLEAIVHAAGDSYHLVRLSGEDGTITRADCAGGQFVSEDGREYIACDEPGPFSVACE